MAATVCVVGSLNTDLVIKAPHLPELGETVLGGEFAVFGGGKGANQAVAAARLGARVTMIGCVGGDAFGHQLREGLAAEAIDIAHVRVDRTVSSGVALITVDPSAHNTIVVASGANMHLTIADVDAARAAILASQVLLLQLEVPLEVVAHAAELAHTHGILVVLDPAPARPLPRELYRHVSVINPNEVEAKFLTGVPIADEQTAGRAARWFLAAGCTAAVIKLGARGAVLATEQTTEAIPGVVVEAVDTTAAGDAFAGALAVALAEGRPMAAAVRFANTVGALKVTRMGAQPSMPTREEVSRFAGLRGLVV